MRPLISKAESRDINRIIPRIHQFHELRTTVARRAPHFADQYGNAPDTAQEIDAIVVETLVMFVVQRDGQPMVAERQLGRHGDALKLPGSNFIDIGTNPEYIHHSIGRIRKLQRDITGCNRHEPMILNAHADALDSRPVSYTHLTLPTSDL